MQVDARSLIETRAMDLSSRVRPPSARRRILDAARELLRQDGYSSFSMEAVARLAEMSRRTIYNQFEDRDALYRESRSELLQLVEEALPYEIECGRDLRAALETFFRTALAALGSPEHRDLQASVIRDGRTLPWLRERYVQSVDRPLRYAVERYILSMRVEGALAPCDASGQANRCLATLKAAAQPHDVAAFDANELALIFVRRLECPDYYPQIAS